MRYGIRDICDIKFYKYEDNVPATTPTFEIDSARTSTLETATTTVYAQGGKGHARLMSWEGERTLTFTVEDALFTRKSLEALVGDTFDTTGTVSVTATTTAGTYKIEAETFVRNEDGDDIPAKITINKAKLQSNLNLPFSSTGDPLAFTFTFDAFPTGPNKEFYTIQIIDDDFTSAATTTSETEVIICKDGQYYSTTITGSNHITIARSSDKTVTVGGTPVAGLTIETTEMLWNGDVIIANGSDAVVKAGSSSTWYVI